MQIKRSEKGFTLVELIVTIVVAAILGAFLVTLMYSVPKSVNPVIQTQNLAAAQSALEKITADYEWYIRGGNGAPAWNSIRWSESPTGGATTNTDITSASIYTYNGSPLTVFNMREVTVTSGDQKLISYFVDK